jgi:hypothetical protein
MSSHKNEKITISISGPVLHGTVSTAKVKCGKANCRCRTHADYLHGPYYRWTGSIEGKLTTVTLSEKEADECTRRIENWKRLQEKLALIVKTAVATAPWNERKID